MSPPPLHPVAMSEVSPDSFVADGEASGLPSAQRRFLIDASLGPRVAGAENLVLHAQFETCAARYPDRLAVDAADGRLTYRQLDQAANALALALCAEGLETEQPVAVLAERSAVHLVALLAILKAGACYLPLDPSHPDPHLARILSVSKARLCLAGAQLARRADLIAQRVIPLTRDMLEAHAPALSATVRPDGLAYLIATSGTTGEPKIVELEHRAAANTVRHSHDAVYGADDLALVPWIDSPAADASIHQIFAPLGAGGTLVPIAGLDQLKTSVHFDAFTAFGATPSMLATLLAGGALPPNLRAVMFGGEACPAALAGHLTATTDIRRAVNAYGPTEAAIYCTGNDVMAWGGDQDQGRIIGKPITNMRVELFDETLKPVPPGSIGEICIAGIGLARGYRGRPDLTAAAFIELTGIDGQRRRYYRSGDLGALLPDGRFEFHGRRDRQAKIRGMRVELDAVERMIGALPGIERALVDLRPDGRGDSRLLAWVIPAGGVAADAVSIRELVRLRLPAAMVPHSIHVLTEFPLTVTGKPDLAALPAPAPAPAPAVGSSPGFDAREAVIAGEWRDVLGHDRFGPGDDFFDVGGDSLMGMELLLRLGDLLGTRISTSDLETGWSIAAIAEASYRAAPMESFEVLGGERQGRPIFWIMPSFLDFPMLDGLDMPQPVYLATTDRMENTKETFADLAGHMLERIRTVQPHGPYLLGGFCLGACAAYEIAVALAASGERVERLALVDKSVPEFPDHSFAVAGRLMRSVRALASGSKAPGSSMVSRILPPRLKSPGWAWRQVAGSRFTPSARLDSSATILLTRHTGWRRGAFRRSCGWRGWIQGDLRVERQRRISAEVGVRRLLREIADTPDG
ncbi:amino acid adenylation domain-containing protein [Iodidimonas sp. SYSU 1G8]|uniref:amino acid adenylation domain-containing protein n=1 Tax=Iodidimonas sp. SYSU 1G8 TaxID=3133967 RepID=UPI0031FF1718